MANGEVTNRPECSSNACAQWGDSGLAVFPEFVSKYVVDIEAGTVQREKEIQRLEKFSCLRKPEAVSLRNSKNLQVTAADGSDFLSVRR